MKVYDPHKSTVEVRQADGHQTNKHVLIISTIVVVVAFALIWWLFSTYGGGGNLNHGA
jgi:hypothetical protein